MQLPNARSTNVIRQPDLKCGPFTRLALHLDLTLVKIDDLFYNCQPQACSMDARLADVLPTIKSLKQVRQIPRLDPDPGVLDSQTDFLFTPGSLNAHFASLCIVDGIDHQVVDQPGNLVLFRLDMR